MVVVQVHEYDIVIEYNGKYIHVKQFGKDSLEITRMMWKQITKACKKYQCNRILGESYTTNALSVMDCYEHIEIFKSAGITPKHRIAWIPRNKLLEDEIKFIETILKNRGLVDGRYFNSFEEAEKWLMEKDS